MRYAEIRKGTETRWVCNDGLDGFPGWETVHPDLPEPPLEAHKGWDGTRWVPDEQAREREELRRQRLAMSSGDLVARLEALEMRLAATETAVIASGVIISP